MSTLTELLANSAKYCIKHLEPSNMINFYGTYLGEYSEKDQVIYLMPKTCIGAIQEHLGKAGMKMSLSLTSIGNHLNQAGLLVKTTDGGHMLRSRKLGVNKWFWAIDAKKSGLIEEISGTHEDDYGESDLSDFFRDL